MELLNQNYEPAVPVGTLNLHPQNPREGDLGLITQSIDSLGFYGALIAQVSSRNIIAGNHRYRSAIENGAETVPVIWLDVTDDAALRIMLADNKASDSATNDEFALSELLKGLMAETGTLEGTAFAPEDLDQIIADLNSANLGNAEAAAAAAAAAPVTEGNTGDDEQPPTPVIPISAQGDLWLCGRHRVLCGDSTEVEAVARLVGPEKADMVFTDPPYNVSYDPESRVSYFSPERLANPLGKIKNDVMTPEAFRAFLDAVYSAIDGSLKPGRAIYICHADTQGHHFRNAFIAQAWKLQSCVIWKKTVIVFGRSDYHWIHEPILYGWKEGVAHVWAGDRTQTTVWEISTDHYKKAECDTDGYVHPTQKPVALMVKAIGNSSVAGETVLDSFGGSGSTMIACEKSGRNARLMELDEKYVDVIVKRWQNFTGLDATLEGTGQTFAEVTAAREAK